MAFLSYICSTMIIIPDIHGRTFWQEAVAEHSGEKVVFLGDYLDPYTHEGLDSQDGEEQLKRVIALKRDRPGKVILLLGNHDMAYLFPEYLSCTRHDHNQAFAIKTLLEENLDCFQMAYSRVIAGKHYIFSHAGFLPVWVMEHVDVFQKACSYPDLVSISNECLKTRDVAFIKALSDVSHLRFGDKDAGSMVWADVREYCDVSMPENVYQVFGHTQLVEEPLIMPQFACLDCRMAFRVNEADGELTAVVPKKETLDRDEIEGNQA